MKQVFVARTPTEAHLVKGVLETRHDLQAPEAVRIVEEYSSSASVSGREAQGWRCPACGEQVEPQFSECWKCGASRPA